MVRNNSYMYIILLILVIMRYDFYQKWSTKSKIGVEKCIEYEMAKTLIFS